MRNLEEWADDNGSTGRCPRCGKREWHEYGCAYECSRCGFGAVDEDEETEGYQDRERDTLASLGLSEWDFR